MRDFTAGPRMHDDTAQPTGPPRAVHGLSAQNPIDLRFNIAFSSTNSGHAPIRASLAHVRHFRTYRVAQNTAQPMTPSQIYLQFDIHSALFFRILEVEC
eukprot:COSAG02_NODE_3270_length_7035_cov_21.981978_4_plen_99_part_00